MEKEMMDKIDRIRDDLDKKIKLHNERYNKFHEEFFTDDIKKIIKDFSNNRIDIRCDLNYEYEFWINRDTFEVICDKRDGHGEYLSVAECSSGGYNDNYLRNLKNHAEHLNRIEKLLDVYIDNADSVIKFITDKYVEINNNRADLINEIVDLLDMDEPKEKHVKITVEWS